MENILVLHVNMFDINQTLFLIKDDFKGPIVTCPIADVAKEIERIAKQVHLDKIYFYGSKAYLNELANTVNKKTNIYVEVKENELSS